MGRVQQPPQKPRGQSPWPLSAEGWQGAAPGLSALVKKYRGGAPSGFELVRGQPLLFEPEHF